MYKITANKNLKRGLILPTCFLYTVTLVPDSHYLQKMPTQQHEHKAKKQSSLQVIISLSCKCEPDLWL